MAMIDLQVLTKGEVRNLTGQVRGVEARKLFDLDRLDRLGEVVEVRIPEDLDAIATSFFQGLFAHSVQHYGRDRFLEHYRFNAGPAIIEQVYRGIDRSLTRRGLALAG